jgi:tetratricopeptide (TPR) repeat protein/tRNA A-37 threonylcarbamoyl transferase component Bud32
MNDLETLFLGARELPESRRAGFLDLHCEGRPKLRAQVEEMLRQAVQAEAFFVETPKPPESRSTPAVDAPAVAEIGEREGSVIGRYKLLQRIGEGGMGIVYMADQEVPVRRRVALKIIKLGMDTRQVVARFEAERQALAMMDHPNIAKVLDAGATESGRPYFVMELVQGVPITEYCDQNKLSLRERLDLFLPVCKAIQSAHQKGVIHRDIKPSNVLVTLHYGDPMPKVIDFGVAKATSMKLTEKTVFTQFGTMIGTPAYMSPEQAEMSSMDVDTRTDVYSLGVLLYELLTGSTPLPQERLRSLAFGQLQKVIAEDEPQKPSTRLSTLEGREKTAVAQKRGLKVEIIDGALRGDLDWIVMKCLEKDRRRRYDTVNGLAMDIDRHLSNEAVLARPPSAAYLFQKAFRRHRAGFLGVAAVLVALSLGLGFATWQAVRARRAEAEALRRRANAEAIARFMIEVFQSPDPERSGNSFTVAEALGAATARLDKDLAEMPELRTSLQTTVGDTYDAIGLPRDAVPLRQRTLEFHRRQSGPEAPVTLTAMSALAHSLFRSHQHAEALRLYRELLDTQRRLRGPESDEALAAAEALSYVLAGDGQVPAAIGMEESCLEIRKRRFGPEHPSTLRILGNLGVHYRSTGRTAEGAALNQQVLELRRKVLGPENPDTLLAIANLAANYYADGRHEEAFTLQSELIHLRRKVLGPGHPQTLMAMHYQAYFEQGRNPELAIQLHREVLALRRKHFAPEHPELIISAHYLALACVQAGRHEEALSVREEVVALRRKANGLNHPHTVDALANLAASYFRAGRQAEAIALLEETAPHLSDDTKLSLRIAPLLAWFGRESTYATAARRILQHSATATRVSGFAEAVEAACLLPVTEPGLAQSAMTAARQAVERGTNQTDRLRVQFALGLACLRSSQFAAAATAFQAGNPNGRETGSLASAAELYRAIALHRLGRQDEARSAFASANRSLRPAPGTNATPLLGETDPHDIVAWLAQREARQLLSLPAEGR